MADGVELWLGYTYPEYHEKAPKDAPRVPWPLPTDGSEDGPKEDWPDDFYKYANNPPVRDLLVQAWIAACEAMGWPTPTPVKKRSRDYFNIHTKDGLVQFAPFGLDKQYGGEYEFEFPDVPIGVPLSSRYYPTFLDYKSGCGTLPNPLVLDDPEMKKMIEVARSHIVKALPWLTDAKVMLVMIHY